MSLLKYVLSEDSGQIRVLFQLQRFHLLLGLSDAVSYASVS